MAPVEKNSQGLYDQKGKRMTAIERIINGNLITNTKDIHELTDVERGSAKDGRNSIIEIQVGKTFVTGGTLKERSELTGEEMPIAHIKADDIRDEEDAELYILEDCILVVGYTLIAILDIKPWEGANFSCRLIHDLRG